jgi:hypothetical protein
VLLLFQALIHCTEDHDVDAFTEEVKKYDTISRLVQIS